MLDAGRWMLAARLRHTDAVSTLRGLEWATTVAGPAASASALTSPPADDMDSRNGASYCPRTVWNCTVSPQPFVHRVDNGGRESSYVRTLL
jgi:hypothetical protein